MKKIKILILCVFVTQLVNAQATNIDSVNWQLRALFGNLSKPSPPKLFNWDMGFHTVDSSLFVQNNTTDTLNTYQWLKMYEEMRDCAYDTTAWLHEDDVIDPTYQYGPDTINMMAMKFDYYRFKPNALNTNIYFDFDTVNNILTDKPNRPGFPYDDYKMFAAAPSKNLASRAEVVYRIGTDNIFYDNFNVLDGTSATNNTYMHINFHDGSGWHTITLGQDNYIPITYPAPGNYAIETIVGEQLGGNVDARSISYMQTNLTPIDPIHEADWTLTTHDLNLSGFEPCDSNLAPEHIKTLIFLEGIDIPDVVPNQNRSGQQIYNEQLRGEGLADLRNFGYRIIVVDWANSRQNLHNNADNLVALLEDLKCGQIIGDLNPDEQFVILGESMGGLVANLALLKMEVPGYTSTCYQHKKHNTRLLITLDTPHWGAHIPMSIQKMARHVQYRTILVGSYASKYFFKKYDIGLDGAATKQMLREHVNTQSLIGVPSYTYHPMRAAYLADVQALGGRPQYCKTIALTNGNMNGQGQTRFWDGQPRVANDRLLEAESNLYGTILGRRIQYAGAYAKLNTDPNGIGQLGELSAGTWRIRIRLKWFGLRIVTGFNSVVYRYWEGDMLPTSTSSGGIYDFNNSLLPSLGVGGIGGGTLNYNGTGNWSRATPNRWGRTGFVGTEGLHWCFIPTASGLNFSNALNALIEPQGVGLITNNTPYDVLMGLEDEMNGTPSPALQDFDDNITIRNRNHLALRNDFLQDLAPANTHPLKRIEYTHSCAPQEVRLLNREIGDNELYLENRVLPWHGRFSIHDKIWVNENSDFYEYDGVPIDPDKIRPRIYSKNSPFEITGATGFAELFTNGSNVQYNPPYTGPYSTPGIVPEVQPCCTNFLFKTTNDAPEPNVLTKEEGMTIFPNPTDNDIILKFVPTEKGMINYVLLDMQGKVLLKGHKTIRSSGNTYYLPVDLPNLANGQYILRTQLNNKTFTNKLNIN